MADSKSSESLQVIGRLEKVDLPEWELFALDAKIDTGAYTSSLHCHHIETFKDDDRLMVQFNLLDPTHEAYNGKLFKMPVHKTKSVKSSNGVSEERIIVKTKVNLAGQTIATELSLTDRTGMRYPVLIGRKLLKGRFLVNVNKKFR